MLGRVGLDINETGQLNNKQNFDEELNNDFEFPKEQPPELVSDGGANYGMANEEEEKMLAAVRSDLVKLLNLPVSCLCC